MAVLAAERTVVGVVVGVATGWGASSEKRLKIASLRASQAAAFAFANLCRCGKVLKDCAHPKIGVDEKRVELAATAEPISYDLALALQLKEHTFSGQVAVELELTEMCTSLTLNAKELTFVSASYASYPMFIEASSIEVDEESTTVKFTFPKALPKGKGKLSIVYDGVLNNQANRAAPLLAALPTRPFPTPPTPDRRARR